MIWFWLSLAIIPTAALLIVGGLLADRWWHRRKARKHAEAQAAVMATALVRSAAAIGGPILDAFRQIAPVMNDAAKSIGRFEEAFRAVPTAGEAPEPEPDRPTR